MKISSTEHITKRGVRKKNPTRKNVLRWTDVMEKAKTLLISSPTNKETWGDDVRLARDERNNPITVDGFNFFFNIPPCVAGSSTPLNGYKIVNEGYQLIEKALPKGYTLVAWYGWGGSGWVAQVKKIKTKTKNDYTKT